MEQVEALRAFQRTGREPPARAWPHWEGAGHKRLQKATRKMESLN